MGFFSDIWSGIKSAIQTVIGGVLKAVGFDFGSSDTPRLTYNGEQSSKNKAVEESNQQAQNRRHAVGADMSSTQRDSVGGEASGVLTDMQGYAGYKTLGRKAKLGGGE